MFCPISPLAWLAHQVRVIIYIWRKKLQAADPVIAGEKIKREILVFGFKFASKAVGPESTGVCCQEMLPPTSECLVLVRTRIPEVP